MSDVPETPALAEETLRPVLRLAVPVLMEQLLLMLVGFSDTTLTGWYLHKPHLAAIGLMGYILWLLTSLFIAIDLGATAMIARFIGARDLESANRVANQTLVLGLIVVVPITLLGYLFADPLVRVMQLEPEAATLAARYLWIVLPAVPFIMLQSVGNACLRGAGDTVTGLLVMAITNVINVALAWALMLGWGPFPELGWNGLAIGTSVSFIAGGVLMLLVLVRGRAGLKIQLRYLSLDRVLMGRILRIGLPGGGDVLALISCQLWFLAIINQLGSLASAAHGVAVRIESIAYLPGFAFQVAAATLTGQYLGARRPDRAAHTVFVACICGTIVMSLAGVLLYAGAEPLARAFVSEEQRDVAEQAAPLLRIVSLAMPALALLMIQTGALRGAGDTRFPLLFTLLGFLGVRIPAAYLVTTVWGWGVEGTWYCMLVDLYFRCALVTARFWHGGWKRVKV